MKTELAKGVWRFLNDDADFIQWCYDHPDGFFWNCGRNQGGDVVFVHSLHSAMRNGKMCPHFRNNNKVSGFENNLTTTSYCKVCSVKRETLEKWAKNYRGNFFDCSICISLAR